jgi:phage terminase large subunit-like protein
MAAAPPTTHSRRSPTPTAAVLKRLKLSGEVAWYLRERGIPLPTCPPKIKTPEPSRVRGARFNPERVDKILAALANMRHTKGEWAGRPLKPDPWQVAYIIAPVYGWERRNDRGDWVRIIRTEYVDIPRKNGKTTIGGGQALYLTGADGEAGAEVYAVATSKDQAGYCFLPVKTLAEGAPALKKHFKTTVNRVVHSRSASYFAVIASVGDVIHGSNVHGAVIDELHVHKTNDVVEAVETGTGARSQPLIVIITTADDGRQGTPYDRKRRYCEQLATGAIDDPTFYGVVWGADEGDKERPGDDPMAEATWAKANPGYGISPTREFMKSAAAKAANDPASLASFMRLHLGVRTKQQTKYLDIAAWDRNASMVDEIALHGKTAIGGLDLAATSDLAALCWLFPDGAGGVDAIWRLWQPEKAFRQLNRRTAGNAEVWHRNGMLTVTEGDVLDYGFIREQLNQDRAKFKVTDVVYDPWNASQLVNDLVADGAPMRPLRQGFASLSGPTKELQRLILAGTAETPLFRHGGNACLRWQVDNFAVATDSAGNVKPDKTKAGDKIDGLAAAVNALDGVTRQQAAKPSVYERRGLIVL